MSTSVEVSVMRFDDDNDEIHNGNKYTNQSQAQLCGGREIYSERHPVLSSTGASNGRLPLVAGNCMVVVMMAVV